MGLARGGIAARWTAMPLVMEPTSMTTNAYSASSNSPRPGLRWQWMLVDKGVSGDEDKAHESEVISPFAQSGSRAGLR